MKKLSLRATINKELKEKGVRSICSYGLRWTTGEERLQINDVCHFRAGYQEYYDKNKKGEICELSTTLLPALEYVKDKASLRKWVSYILLRSPFKDCFKTKNLQAAWRYGIQMDVDKPLSNVVASLIALREGWEFPSLLKVFTTLVRNRINEDVAFIVSRMVTINKKGEYVREYWGGHQTLFCLDVAGMRSFIKNGMREHGDPLRIAKEKYKIFYSTRSEEFSGGAKLEDLLFKKAKVKKEGWGNSTYLTKEQFLKAAKEIEKELLS